MTRLALAGVVAVVRQPEVNGVHLRMPPQKGHHLFGQGLAHLGIGIAEVGVEGPRVEQRAPAVNLRQPAAVALPGLLHLVPSQAVDAYGGGGPAMACRLEDEVAFPQLLLQRPIGKTVHLLHRRHRFRARQQGIVVMRVPGLEKFIGRQKLGEIGVESALGQPVDQLQHVFKADRAFNAEAPVAVAGGLGYLHGGLSVVAQQRPLRPRPDKPEAKLVQEPVRRDQHAARVGARDHAAALPSQRDGNGVVAFGVGHRRQAFQPRPNPKDGVRALPHGSKQVPVPGQLGAGKGYRGMVAGGNAAKH